MATERARDFLTLRASLPVAAGEVLDDAQEWGQWHAVGDPVLHIELRRWADILVVAPLSANTLAKLANGLCDNLVTCVVRAWDFTPAAPPSPQHEGDPGAAPHQPRHPHRLAKPVLVAPAMNTHMWHSPFTERHLRELEALGVQVVQPVSKTLACADVGMGALAPVEQIAEAVHDAAAWVRELAARRVA
mmetsp:Transcript_7909/g.29265  ORF Transcript_7909/g.29265 Transcript_7909/m.29265 type:complete len:189 (+) Transcript_7909:640-1206(+)